MYTSVQIAQCIKSTAESKNIVLKNMLEECGLNKNALSTMLSRKSNPSIDTLGKIADYLGVSVDYLLGRTTEMNVTLTEEEINLLETFKQSKSPKLMKKIADMMKHKSPKQLEAIATILEQD